MAEMEKILLGYGSGGKLSHRLLTTVFLKYFQDEELHKLNDAACLDFPGKRLVFSTDTYVVDPLFFPGGDIGRLAVCGTVNDVAVMGARPLFLSAGFIIEEGLPVSELEKILYSMQQVAAESGIRIVTGDTKVVPKGAADKLFINTAGIGVIEGDRHISGSAARPGDRILINGPIAEHGITVMARRGGLNLDVDIRSDANPLNHLTGELIEKIPDIHVMRDPTRGGIATTLNEIARQSRVGIQLEENMIPVLPSVKSVCEILGLDPLYVANEGKVLVIVPESDTADALAVMKANPYGRDACVIGKVCDQLQGKVILNTRIGGQRVVEMLAGEQLPRIC